MTPNPPSTHEELRERLYRDDTYYAESCLRIVDQDANIVPLRPKPAQQRFLAIKAQQEAERKPVRIIVLKARKEGISTITQGLLIKRVTQNRNHNALVVAHDGSTASEIFTMGETMYAKLPDEVIAGYQLKPGVESARKGSELHLGEPSIQRRHEGHLGLNSSYVVDTANEYEAKRGFTNHSLHISELAFYKAAEKKLKSLFNTVPDRAGTMIVIESTADGYNLFRKLWVLAITGQSAYAPLFIPWYEEPDYQLPFVDDEEREEFFASIGTGEYGEAEPDLIEKGVTLEQLKWRRWAIINKAAGDLRSFWQEYPASWQEAFLSAGRQVFSPSRVSKVIEQATSSNDACLRGILRPRAWKEGKYMGQPITIPVGGLWVPEKEADVGVATPLWRLWEKPDPGSDEVIENGEVVAPFRPAGQYVVMVDSASGRETSSEGTDYFAIQVINHRTRAQVAQYHVRNVDADRIALQAFLIASYFTVQWPPIIGVEITGGYGISIATKLYKVWRWPRLFFRRPAETKREKPDERLGFSMDVKTKPQVVDLAKELLRTEDPGIRSLELAAEMQTYVRDDKGKMGAEEDEFDDLLECWMVANYIATQEPLRRDRRLRDAGARARVKAPSMGLRPTPTRYAA